MPSVGKVITGVTVRSLDILEDHPPASEAEGEARKLLAEKVTVMRDMTAARETGKAAGQKASGRRKLLAEEIVNFIARPLLAVAKVTHAGFPERIRRYRVPNRHVLDTEEFLAASTALYELALSEKDALLAHGLPPTLLGEFEASLAEYVALPAEASAGKNAATKAQDTLEKTAQEMLDLIQYLDGLMRYRFKDQPELLAAWATARRVPWPRKKRKAARAKPQAKPQAEAPTDSDAH